MDILPIVKPPEKVTTHEVVSSPTDRVVGLLQSLKETPTMLDEETLRTDLAKAAEELGDLDNLGQRNKQLQSLAQAYRKARCINYATNILDASFAYFKDQLAESSFLASLQYQSLLDIGFQETTGTYHDYAPIPICKDRFLARSGDQLLLSPKGDHQALLAIADRITTLENLYNSISRALGGYGRDHTVGLVENMEQHDNLIKRAREYFETQGILAAAELQAIHLGDEQIEHDIALLESLSNKSVWDKLNNVLPLGDFETVAQVVYFLKYANRAGAEDVKRLGAYAETIGPHFLRSFLSLAHGDPNVAEHIFTIAEKLPDTAAKTVFRTYGDIVGAVDQVVDILGDQQGATPELLQVIQTNLYRQGVRLLEEYGAEAATCAEEACADVGRKLEERLALAKSSVFAMGAVTRQLVKDGAFSFEKFSQLSLVQDTPPLSEELAKQIRTMHQANTDQYPESLRDYWRGTLAEALESEDADQKFVYVTMGEDILAVMRVIDQGDYWYGASFNVNPTIQGSRVGSELLKKVIADMGNQKPFVADVYAENPMLDNYLNTFGFIITKTTEDYHGTGTTVHQITWEKPD